MSTENVNIVRLEEGAFVLLQPGLAPAALDLETQTYPKMQLSRCLLIDCGA